MENYFYTEELRKEILNLLGKDEQISRKVDDITRNLFGRRQDSGRKDNFSKKENHYEFIPFEVKTFISIWYNILKLFPPAKKDIFVDVGSGPGEKALLINWLFNLNAFGIEYNKLTFSFGQTLFGNLYKYDYGYREQTMEEYIHNIKEDGLIYYPILFNKDGKKVDYGNFQYIYTYCPIYEPTSLFELYDQILNTMKPGAIWFEVYSLEQYLKSRKIDYTIQDKENIRIINVQNKKLIQTVWGYSQ